MDKHYEARDGKVLLVEDVTDRVAQVQTAFNELYPYLEEKTRSRDQYVEAAKRIDEEIRQRIESSGLDMELIKIVEPEKAQKLGFFSEFSTS